MPYIGRGLSEGRRQVRTYTATASQTTFAADYDPGYVDVYQNGVRLFPGDFTATSGSDIVLTVAASASDEITIVSHDTFSVANINNVSNTYLQAQGYGTGDVANNYLNTTLSTKVDETHTGNVTIDGRLGIENVNPQTPLDVTGQIRTSLDTTHYGTFNGLSGALYISHRNDTNDGAILLGGGGGGTFTERMRITPDGDVGIGNTSPATNLHIRNSTGAPSIRLQGVFAADAYDIVRATSTGFLGFTGNQNSFSGFTFSTTDGSGTTSERVKINNSGHMTKADQPLFVGRLDSVTTTASNYTIGVGQIYNRSMTFDSSTDRITVPTTGYYMIHAQQLYQSSGGIYLKVQTNGASRFYGYGNMGSSHRDLVATGIWYLNANDYVDFYLQGTSTYSWGGGHSFCYIQLVQ